MAHRLIICSALSGGESRIKNIALSDDIKATVGCVKGIGAQCSVSGGEMIISGTENISVTEELYCGESASTLRFILPICLTKDNNIKFTGSPRLFERPLDEYEKLFRSAGIDYVRGRDFFSVSGCLRAGEYTVSGSVSSQYISGLLFALPLLEGDSVIKVREPFVSESYVDMTLDALAVFGIEIKREDRLTFVIKGGQKYKPADTVCEGDFSNSAFFRAMRFIGGNVKVTGLDGRSRQGDRVYEKLFSALSCGTPEIDVSDCIDLAPLLFSVAALSNGAVFTGTERLRYKESDRAEAMRDELSKFGVKMAVKDNSVRVFAGEILPPKEETDSHGDHRIFMAVSLLLLRTGGVIKNAECINKSFPDFFEKTGRLNVKGDILNEYDI